MADKTIGVHTTDFFNHVGFKTGASLFSELGIVQVPTKSVGPSKPTLSAITAPADSAGVLKVTLVLPTTNTDGSALVRTELVKVALHYKESPGVDTSDPAIEFPPVEELLWAPGDTDTHYVRVRVMDSHGRWSALSDDEKSAAASPVSVSQEDSGLWAHRLGYESVFTDSSPSVGSVAWANVVLYWKDNKYEIADGNTDKKYIWWDYSLSTTTFQVADTAPSLEKEDCIVGYNDNGVWRLMVYSPMIMADYIRTGTLTSTNWGADEGSQLDLDSGTLKLGGSSDPHFSVDALGNLTATGASITGSVVIQSGSGISNLSDAGDLATKDTADYDTDVSGTKPPVNADNTKTIIDGGLITTGYINLSTAGNIRSGQTAYNDGTGFWLGNVGGTPQFSIGDGGNSNYLTWDGSTLKVRGDIVAGDISFADLLGGTNTSSLVLGTSGNLRSGQTAYNTGTGFWLGNVSGTPKLSIGNPSGAHLTWDGSTLAVSSLTVGSGSTWGGNQIGTAYIPNLDASKITTGILPVNARGIDSPDVRNDNEPPSFYYAKGKGIYSEFKYRTAIEAPGSSTYGQLKIIVPWGDASGGPVVQQFYEGADVHKRYSIDVDTWGSWTTVQDGADVTAENTAADTARVQGYTIIEGGYIKTDFLTASNIQTGTLDASKITVTHLSASSITTGELDFSSITKSGLSVLNSELAGGITYDKISSISADTITTGTLTGRTVRTSSGTTRAEMASGYYPFAYYYGGDKKFYVDTGGNVYAKTLKDTNGQTLVSGGIFQGAKLIDSGSAGSHSYGDGLIVPKGIAVWENVSKTVPSGKKWVVIVSQHPSTQYYPGFYNADTAYDAGTVVGFDLYLNGFWKSGTTQYGASLPAGSYSSLYLAISNTFQIRDPDQDYNQWATCRAYWMVWEVPA